MGLPEEHVAREGDGGAVRRHVLVRPARRHQHPVRARERERESMCYRDMQFACALS